MTGSPDSRPVRNLTLREQVLEHLREEILSSRLEPGAELRHHVPLRPLVLRDHYSREREPLPLRGEVTVRCEVGWGESPVTPHGMSITGLLEWQRLASSLPVGVVLA